MIRNKLIFAALGALLSGCGALDIFGSDEVLPANTIADSSNPLSARASYLAGSHDYTYLSTEQLLSVTVEASALKSAVAERSFEGVIVRGVSIAPTQGHHNPVLVREPVESDESTANPVYLVRLIPPEFPLPVGSALSREVIFAAFITREEAEEINSVTLVSGQNRIRLRIR